MFSLVRSVFIAVVALLPGGFALWWGRNLARLHDDPALPERLLANRTRTAFVFCFSVAFLAVFAGVHSYWALPLLVLARMVAGYWTRRVLYGETWTLRAYLSFFGRLLFATFGFWTLLGIVPWLAVAAGSRDWIVGALIAAALIAWSAAYPAVFRAVLRARAIDDPAIVSRFAEMMNACELAAVRLAQVDVRGGMFANAVALPSRRQPTVLISSTLVERLDPDETAAILAHELAHIEYYNPRRLRLLSIRTYSLIAIGALLGPVTRMTAPEALTGAMVLWPLVLLVAMAWQAHSRQKHETASDLRAVALSGKPDALIRALSKLHAFARLPRRWDTEYERHATHPSLARRIQAIRAAAGAPPVSLRDTTTITGTDGTSSVTFTDAGLVWREPSATFTIDYTRLTMLRVDARTSGATRLVAVDMARRRWEIVLAPSEVARAQAALDIVDARLAAAAAPPATSFAVARAAALFTSLAAVTIGHLAAAIVAAFACLLPAPLAAAAGAAAIGAAGVVWRDHSVWKGHTEPWVAAALFLCGLTLVGITFSNRRESAPSGTRQVIGLIAAGAIVAWLAITLVGVGPIGLHRGARAWPAATVLTLALAGALALERWRAARYASAPVACAGLFALFLGSTTFIDRFAGDPLLAPAGPVTVRTIAAEPAAEFPLPSDSTDVSLSPGAQYVAALSEDDEEQTTVHAGRIGGALADFAADEALFVDEGRLMLLERQRASAVLRVIDLAAGNRTVWSLPVSLRSWGLSVDRASRTWRVFGHAENGDLASAAGRIGERTIHEERWKSPADGGYGVQALAVSKGALLALETRYLGGLLDRTPFWYWTARQEFGPRVESRFSTIDDRGYSTFATSRLDVTCRTTASDDEGPTCTAFDGTRTHFFAIDAAQRRVAALASMIGRFFYRRPAGGGWIAGIWDGAPVLIRAATHEAIRVDGRKGDRPFTLAVAENVIGTVSSDTDGSTIRLYPLK